MGSSFADSQRECLRASVAQATARLDALQTSPRLARFAGFLAECWVIFLALRVDLYLLATAGGSNPHRRPACVRFRAILGAGRASIRASASRVVWL